MLTIVITSIDNNRQPCRGLINKGVNVMRKFAMGILALLLLVPSTVLATGDEGNGEDATVPNSVQIKIGGVPVAGTFKEGDVVYRDSAADGEECTNPSISIRARGDVKRVRVGPEDGSCDIVVQKLELNNTPMPDPDSVFQSSSGYQWEVDILAKIVGINSIDDLTKTKPKPR